MEARSQVVNDVRFVVPLYTVAEAARYVRVPSSTFRAWAMGYEVNAEPGRRVSGDPVITALPADRGHPSIPFIGLAEGMVLAAFRKAGVSLQHIRQAVPVLEEEVGLDHALASRRLYSDGAVILYDYVVSGAVDTEAAEDLAGLTRVVDNQLVFADVVRDYLRRITYGDDGLASALSLPYGDDDLLRIRPEQAGGRPLFVRGRAPLDAVLARWRAGERMADIAKDFQIPRDDLEDAIRVASN
ncbi:DUF433 domain-containing protein [Euzebya sp.]|uniref:DUF433 domain-containing protein n=1 Tax=Euzebya sp. TaxID=1971409 RepID=UPI0035185A6C